MKKLVDSKLLDLATSLFVNGIVVLAIILIISNKSEILAEERDTPFNKRCNAFNTPKEFVKQSNLYCLRQSNSRRCEKQAASFFEKCEYAGDFRNLNQKANKQLLMLFVLSASPKMSEGIKSKS